jgi:hypothetical protein
VQEDRLVVDLADLADQEDQEDHPDLPQWSLELMLFLHIKPLPEETFLL